MRKCVTLEYRRKYEKKSNYNSKRTGQTYGSGDIGKEQLLRKNDQSQSNADREVNKDSSRVLARRRVIKPLTTSNKLGGEAMKDYSKLEEIIVKSQAELDEIPTDFQGRIYIEFGTWYSKAILSKRYPHYVVAWENSNVEAWGNSNVEARGNSNVVASANVQVVDYLQGAKIKISGNARIVYNPKSIHEFMDFYGIKHTKTKAIFYKAVHKSDDKYFADYDEDFVYSIGQTAKVLDLDKDAENECGRGIHISTQHFALDFGCNWKNLAIIEVEAKIEDIILPKNSNGKVRVSKVKVLREVPLEECGTYGKILAKRRLR